MSDDKELEEEGGKVLPLRQMMSLISNTDPADALHSTIVPPDASDPQPAGGHGPPLATLPVEPPDIEAS